MKELIDLLDQVSMVKQREGQVWRSQHRDQYPGTLGTDGRTYWSTWPCKRSTTGWRRTVKKPT